MDQQQEYHSAHGDFVLGHYQALLPSAYPRWTRTSPHFLQNKVVLF